MDDTGIYTRQGLGQPTGFGSRPALLVIDFVNGFIDPAILGGGNIAEAVAGTGPLLAAARTRAVPVVFTRIVYAEDGSDAGVWCEKVPRLRELTETNPASHVVDSLAPRDGEIVIRKRQASAFFGTPLADILRFRGVDTVVVTGCTTSGCVRGTLIDAISHDFRAVAVADCIGDRALGPHEANMFDIAQKYADVVGSKEVIASAFGASYAAG